MGSRSPWIVPPLACGMVALLVYLQTLAPGLTWLHEGADGGDLAAAVASNGVSHPTGYPTYLLLGRLFAALPWGDVAFRLNLLSATCAAATVAVLCWLLSSCDLVVENHQHWRLLPGSLAPVAAALSFAFSPLFWSQAVITEVYTLNALFVAGLLLLTWHHPERKAAVCFLLGLGLGNHVSLLLLVPTLLLLMCWSGDGTAGRGRTIGMPLALLGAGLAVYACIPLRATRQPPVNWGDAHTWQGFFWLVTAAPYRAYIGGVAASELLARLSAWANLLVHQFGWPGLTLGLVGLWDMWYTGRRSAGGLLTGVFLYTVYALLYGTRDSYIYLIPAYLMVAVFLGRGLTLLVQVARVWVGGREGTVLWRWPVPILVTACLILLPLHQLSANWQAVDASRDRQAIDYVETTMTVLPPRSLVVTASDEHTFALWYGQISRGRDDVVVVDRDLTQFAWYRQQMRRRVLELAAVPDSDGPEQFVVQLIKAARPAHSIFLADDDATLLAAFQWLREDVLYRLARE